MEEPRMTPKALGKKVVLCPEMRSKYVCWGVGGTHREGCSPGLELEMHDVINSQLLPSSCFPS